jgi:hypothetical protein
VILTIVFRYFGLQAPKDLSYLAFQTLLTLQTDASMQKLFYVSSQKRTFIMDDHSQNIGKSSSWAQKNKGGNQNPYIEEEQTTQ